MARTRENRGRPRLPRWVIERRQRAGTALAERRSRAGLTQIQLATATKLSWMTIGRIERGESGSDESYRRIAERLHLPADWQTNPDVIGTAIGNDEELGLLDRGLDFVMASDEVGPMVVGVYEELARIARIDRTRAEFVAAGVLRRLERIKD